MFLVHFKDARFIADLRSRLVQIRRDESVAAPYQLRPRPLSLIGSAKIDAIVAS
jgi:hypothetical protein